MDQVEISRRETLGLAKFGLLLAAGLGVVETSNAAGGSPEVGSVSVKLFKATDKGYTLFKTLNVPAVQANGAFGDQLSQVTLKFWQPASGKIYSTVSDVMIKSK